VHLQQTVVNAAGARKFLDEMPVSLVSFFSAANGTLITLNLEIWPTLILKLEQDGNFERFS